MAQVLATQTLYEQVVEAQEDAHNGNLSQKRTVAMMDLFRQHLEAEDAERRKARRQVLRTALSTLSYSEEQALKAVMEALPSPEGGLVVASQVADRVGLTRSVIVNALRKLESAGVIESRSLGQKGTFIKILVPGLRDQLLSVA